MVGKWKAGLLATAMAAGTFVGVSTAAVSLVTAAPAAAAQAPLNLGNEQGLLWPCSFNPFNPSDAPYSVGVTYETLDFIDALNNAKVTPWLASVLRVEQRQQDADVHDPLAASSSPTASRSPRPTSPTPST